MEILLWVAFAFIAGSFLGWFLKSAKTQKSFVESRILLDKSNEDKQKLELRLQEKQEKYLIAEKKISELEANHINHQTLRTQFSDHFKSLSQEIIDSKSKQFQDRVEKDLSGILNPLRDKIQSFQKSVEDNYYRSSEERNSLKGEIKQLCNTHDKLKEETQQLTQALKGNVKVQGQWGEVILNTILEHSGLIEGEHYTTQGKGLGMKDEEGRLQKPDVVINLPGNRHLVIDAKVSLTHYEQFISAALEEKKQEFLSAFLSSLKSHVKQLSEKHYSQSNQINAPDFTFMFFPIEGALSLAFEKDRELFEFSWKRSIAIVGPTSLLAAVKVAASIWRREKQNRSALEIAQAAGSLYDKCSAFMTDLEKIGENLRKADTSYQSAVSKLRNGQGNIISKLERIKKLGACTTKQIPEQFMSYSD